MTTQGKRSVEEADSAMKAQTLAQRREDAALIERLLDLFVVGLSSFGGQRPRDDIDHVVTLLCTKAFNSLRCAYELLLMGYYSQAITLIRTVEDDWLTCIYIIKYPAKTHIWLEGKRTPFYGEMLNELLQADVLDANLRDQLRDSYDISSGHIHPRTSALAAVVRVDPAGQALLVGGHYDAELFTGTVSMLLPAASQMLSILAAFPWPDDMWRSQVDEARDAVVNWQKKVNESLGEQ